MEDSQRNQNVTISVPKGAQKCLNSWRDFPAEVLQNPHTVVEFLPVFTRVRVIELVQDRPRRGIYKFHQKGSFRIRNFKQHISIRRRNRPFVSHGILLVCRAVSSVGKASHF